MTKTVHGIAHGRTIELAEDLGVADGQEVEVQVRMKIGARKKKDLPGPPPGWQSGGKKTVAGALADLCTPEEDRLLEEIQRDRKRERRRSGLRR
jgi:hypothetical protein